MKTRVHPTLTSVRSHTYLQAAFGALTGGASITGRGESAVGSHTGRVDMLVVPTLFPSHAAADGLAVIAPTLFFPHTAGHAGKLGLACLGGVDATHAWCSVSVGMCDDEGGVPGSGVERAGVGRHERGIVVATRAEAGVGMCGVGMCEVAAEPGKG